jgi:hypothetical protein
MDSSPEHAADPWNIADLSQLAFTEPLPAQPPRPSATRTKAGGPIRTARSALRLRTSATGKAETENVSKTARRVGSTQLLRDTSSSRAAPPRTVTPRHQHPVAASSGRFRGLMPEFSFASLNNDSRRSVSQKSNYPVMACSTESSSSPSSSSLLNPRTHPSSCQRSCHDLLF